MYRLVVLHEQEPDAQSYAEHAELCTHGYPQPSVLFAAVS